MNGPYKVSSDWDAHIWIDGIGEAERRLEVTPAIAGWAHLSFRSYTFRAGQVINGESASDEMSMVLLSGAVAIEVEGPGGSQTWQCDGRESVFDGPPFAIYLPPGCTYKTIVQRDADCVYGRAPAEGIRPPRLITPGEMRREVDRDDDRGTRILDTDTTEHLICEERSIESGSWGFMETEVRELDEVVYVRTDPPDGWGLQYLDDPARGIDEALVVRNGDAVIVRGGARPLVTSPATRLYALAYRAGELS